MRKKQPPANFRSKATHQRDLRQQQEDAPYAPNKGGRGGRDDNSRRDDGGRNNGGATRARQALPCPKGALMIWGRHAVSEALKNPSRQILTLYVSSDMIDWLDEIRRTTTANFDTLEIIKMEKPALTTAMAATFNDAGGGDKAVHQGIVAIARPLPQINLLDWLENITEERPVVLLLDQITDSRNIGAIMRSARAFRASALITTDRHCPDETGVMLRTASGAAEHIPLIRVVNLARAMEILQSNGFMLAGMAALGDVPLSSLADHDRLGIIMGAEGKGLRRLTKEHADLLVRIPIDDSAESLNVSNAAAVALYAAQRGN